VLKTAKEYLRPENRTVLMVKTKDQAATGDDKSGSKGAK
jgi:hypothetical protein